MASTDKNKPTPGVRGPGGPPPPPAPGGKPAQGKPSASSPGSRPPRAMPTKPASPARRRFEEISYPIVERLSRVPKFLVVVTPGVLLFLGLVLKGSWSWVGGVLLLVVAGILAWLTALSWPVVAVRSRIVRVVIIAVVVGFAYFKFTGRL